MSYVARKGLNFVEEGIILSFLKNGSSKSDGLMQITAHIRYIIGDRAGQNASLLSPFVVAVLSLRVTTLYSCSLLYLGHGNGKNITELNRNMLMTE